LWGKYSLAHAHVKNAKREMTGKDENFSNEEETYEK